MPGPNNSKENQSRRTKPKENKPEFNSTKTSTNTHSGQEILHTARSIEDCQATIHMDHSSFIPKRNSPEKTYGPDFNILKTNQKESSHELTQPSFLTHQGSKTSRDFTQTQPDPPNGFKHSQHVSLSPKRKVTHPTKLELLNLNHSISPEDPTRPNTSEDLMFIEDSPANAREAPPLKPNG
ncbi:unnamed protein product [Arabis nemorensis]|uniref:Uncharacterized protein n=1 Tax=Arabis nemorensis TaxID=586526 RepID=A0A565ASV6_9BRAS|nr:unnamed protein product [Arabis nemorensis]